MSTFSWVYKNHTLSETPSPPPQKSTHQHFLSAKNPHENNKKSGQKVKCTEKMLIFTEPHPRKCMVCTLVKMLTFMDGPLETPQYHSIYIINFDECFRKDINVCVWCRLLSVKLPAILQPNSRTIHPISILPLIPILLHLVCMFWSVSTWYFNFQQW